MTRKFTTLVTAIVGALLVASTPAYAASADASTGMHPQPAEHVVHPLYTFSTELELTCNAHPGEYSFYAIGVGYRPNTDYDYSYFNWFSASNGFGGGWGSAHADSAGFWATGLLEHGYVAGPGWEHVSITVRTTAGQIVGSASRMCHID